MMGPGRSIGLVADCFLAASCVATQTLALIERGRIDEQGDTSEPLFARLADETVSMPTPCPCAEMVDELHAICDAVEAGVPLERVPTVRTFRNADAAARHLPTRSGPSATRSA